VADTAKDLGNRGWMGLMSLVETAKSGVQTLAQTDQFKTLAGSISQTANTFLSSSHPQWPNRCVSCPLTPSTPLGFFFQRSQQRGENP
jgi:hypothetical protein